MRHVLHHFLAGLIFAALCGCVHQADGPENGQYQGSTPQPNISICDLKAVSRETVGVRKTIRAVYSSDSTRYEFFKDAACEDGLIAVSYKAGSGDQTVQAFYRNWRDRCKARGLNYCAQTAEVTADVAVVIEASGIAALEILTVWNVSFIK